MCLLRMELRARRQKLLLLRHKYVVGRNEDQRHKKLSYGLDFMIAGGF